MNYDFIGRRFNKKVEQNPQIISHLKYLYFGFRLVETLDALKNDTVMQQYIWDKNDESSMIKDG